MLRSFCAFFARASCVARSYGSGAGATTLSPRSLACSYSEISNADGGIGTSGPYSAIRSSGDIAKFSRTCSSSCWMRNADCARATSSRCTESRSALS
ncbi:Uncharacterised protein [Mycobacteroides abscessus subsp. abscessus]|nr:Uncharacterised protein [Mycobacteroides abscessus subsp. abscessus]